MRLAIVKPYGETKVEEHPLGRVSFASFRELRGKVRSPLKLRWAAWTEAQECFAELQTVSPGVYALTARGDDFEVFLNGRPVRIDERVSVSLRDGDLVRIADHRFTVGTVPQFPRDDVEAAFLETIRARPNDDEVRLVYADWLEEQEDFAHAEMLRLELMIRATHEDDPGLKALTARFVCAAKDVASRAWRVRVARPLIEGCAVAFELVCPKKWESLEATDRPAVRHCNACSQDVVLCTSLGQAREIAKRGGCVAVDPVIDRCAGDLEELRLVLGRLG